MDGQQVLEWEFSNVGSMCLQDGMQKVKVGPRFWWHARLPVEEHVRRGPGRGLGARELPARPVRSVQSWVVSVQLMRLSHRSVLMVKRRRTLPMS